MKAGNTNYEKVAEIDGAVIFAAGYYEWNVLVNDKVIYTFDDISEYIDGNDNKETLQNLINEFVDCMIEELNEKSDDRFSDLELTELKAQMFDKWSYHYL